MATRTTFALLAALVALSGVTGKMAPAQEQEKGEGDSSAKEPSQPATPAPNSNASVKHEGKARIRNDSSVEGRVQGLDVRMGPLRVTLEEGEFKLKFGPSAELESSTSGELKRGNGTPREQGSKDGQPKPETKRDRDNKLHRACRVWLKRGLPHVACRKCRGIAERQREEEKRERKKKENSSGESTDDGSHDPNAGNGKPDHDPAKDGNADESRNAASPSNDSAWRETAERLIELSETVGGGKPPAHDPSRSGDNSQRQQDTRRKR